MTNFMYLFRGGMDMETTPPAQLQANMQKWVAWMQQLGKQGHLKGGEPLDRKAARVLRHKKPLTDGPYAEAKDVVGGYLIVTAENLDQATELAKGCPILEQELGTVEVRAIHELKL
jgi:hypothetical protein